MKKTLKLLSVVALAHLVSGCLVTSIVGGAVSAVTTTVETAVDVVDTVTPDILD